MEVPLKMTTNNLKLLYQRLNLLVHSSLNQLNSIAVVTRNGINTTATSMQTGVSFTRITYLHTSLNSLEFLQTHLFVARLGESA